MNYTLHLGDCLEIMPTLEAGSIDAIIADWPYGTTACKWDSVIPFEPLWKECKRVIKPNGAIVLFGSQPFTSMLVMSNLGWFKCEWVWEKDVHSNFANAKYHPLKYHENILVFSGGTCIYNPQMRQTKKPSNIGGGGDYKRVGFSSWKKWKPVEPRNTVMKYPKSTINFNTPKHNDGVNGSLHPTQKPVALLEYLIKTYTNEGDLVLDNTFGSCTTGEACLRTGRRFVGIEKDLDYFRIGQERMERVTAELRGEFVPKPAKGKIEDLPMFEGAAA